jgi:5-methyltetrahydropteroyltriglutamate--homocysteine methyltransferase
MAPAAKNTVLLPTTVVGSYSVPEWLERLKTEYYQRRISAQHLAEINEVAIKAAVKDQELAGIDIVSDGELRRDNDVDYFLARIPGVQIPQRAKTDYFDYYEAEVTRPLPELPGGSPGLGLADDFRFTRQLTDKPVKFSFTGPFSLSRRIRDEAYTEPGELVRALARRLNAEARELAEAGADLLQIDEPFLAGYPEQVELAVEAVNIVTEGVPVTWALHVCYGNRYARPSWEGHYDFLFPAVKTARVDQIVLEFARKGLDDLRLIQQHGWDRWLGLGVIDVKSSEVEAAELVASRIRRALDYVPADRLMINPDCGLRHLAPEVARQKLRAMVAGVALVRTELPAPRRPGRGAEPAAPHLPPDRRLRPLRPRRGGFHLGDHRPGRRPPRRGRPQLAPRPSARAHRPLVRHPARPGLVAGTRNPPGVFGCRVIVRRDRPWESPH